MNSLLQLLKQPKKCCGTVTGWVQILIHTSLPTPVNFGGTNEIFKLNNTGLKLSTLSPKNSLAYNSVSCNITNKNSTQT